MYQVILFDVDGVLLSEKRCFDTTTLSVWELLYSEGGLGLAGESFNPNPPEEEILRIRQTVMDEDQVLEWLKSRGMNSNWDMVSLLFGYQLQRLLYLLHEKQSATVEEILQRPLGRKALVQIGEMVRSEGIAYEPDFGGIVKSLQDLEEEADLLESLDQLAYRWSEVRTTSFSHGGTLWKLGREVYQEWYLGRELFEKVERKAALFPEKKGFLEQEIPLAEPSAIREVLDNLASRGIALGIGTGRPAVETEVPLAALDLWSAFDSNRIVTASDVQQAEEVYQDYAPLGKPKPFTYLKAFYGRDASDAKSVAARLPLPDGDRVLVVGDSVADLLAARDMGCDFAVTLTGLTGEKARAKFEQLNADYILNDVTELTGVIDALEEEERRREEEQTEGQPEPGASQS
ncbi:HAD family hydrolase [Salinithrix halophila]|uniref:HAD family hydrolase n=1 Tax=Salinithrix halophila TaxID=1485204 RepID=A0ABV8JDT8_9BACL